MHSSNPDQEATIAGPSPAMPSSVDGTAPEPAVSPHTDLLAFLQPSTKVGTLGRLGGYEIQDVVGRGGMGVVLKAFDEKLHRVVAIKVLGPQYATNATARKRFEREARTAAAVTHDHIVPIYHVDEVTGVPFLVMPLVVGLSLQDRIDQFGPLKLEEILRIGAQIARGLAAAHAEKLVHRDIKPANILLEGDGQRVKITDFGLARAVDDASVTQSGVITGTPMFMAPEQARGEMIDHRADLFSLGSVLYAMCTGHSPFQAQGTHAVLMRVIEDDPQPIQELNPALPDWLDAIIRKLLTKKPADRFQTAKEVAELLEDYLAHLQHPEVTPKPRPVSLEGVEETLLDKRAKFSRTLQVFSLITGAVCFACAMTAPNYWLLLSHEERLESARLLTIAGGSLWLCAFLIRQRWQVNYRGHTVCFTKYILLGESLEIDGRCVARRGLWSRRGFNPPRELCGVLGHGDGIGDEIIASTTAALATVLCQIVVQRGKYAAAARTPSWTTEETTPVPLPTRTWRRLAVPLGVHSVVCLVLFVLIAGYLDGGWWATPCIEFSAAAGFLGLSFWQFGRGTRPRWLPVIPLLLAPFFGFLGLALWPYGTERHFSRLVRQGRFEEANQLLAPPDRFAIEPGGLRFHGGGAVIQFAEQDLPLIGRAGDWGHFTAHLEQNSSENFPFYLGAGKDDRCELHFVANEGAIHYQKVRFKDWATTRRMMPDADKKPEPPPAAKLPENAEDVLPAMIGAWRVVIEHKVIAGRPANLRTEGFADIAWAAGNSFLRMREQMAPDGVNFVQIFTFDQKSKDFRNLHFDASGVVMGPTMSRWDSRTHSLTGTSQPDAVGVFVKNTRFVDADTMEWEAIVRDKTSKTLFETLARLTRIAGPANINEDEAPAPPPTEMNILFKFLGEWRTTGKIEAKAIGLLKLPVLANPLSTTKATKALGGRFVEVRETLAGFPKENNYALMTYDPQQRGYHMWTFAPSGYLNEARGTWDAAQERLTWSWKEPDPGADAAAQITLPASGVAHMKWRDAATYETSVEVRNSSNQPIADAQSTSTRQGGPLQKPEGPAGVKLPEKADEVLPALVGVWDFAMDFKMVDGKPSDLTSRGQIAMDLVAKNFLRRRQQTTAGQGINQLSILGFEPNTQTFNEWHFDAVGTAGGPISLGRWNPGGHAVTWKLDAPDKSGTVTALRFEDANAAVLEFTVYDKEHKVSAQTVNRMTRSKEPSQIREDALPLGKDGQPLPLPREMAFLHKLAGAWRTEGEMKVPFQAPSKSRQVARRVLGGRFVELRETAEPINQDFYSLMTYDGGNKAYRLFNFPSIGQASEYKGVWDAAGQKMTWTGAAPEGGDLTATMEWRGPDEYKQNILVKNAVGEIMRDVQSTTKRAP